MPWPFKRKDKGEDIGPMPGQTPSAPPPQPTSWQTPQASEPQLQGGRWQEGSGGEVSALGGMLDAAPAHDEVPQVAAIVVPLGVPTGGACDANALFSQTLAVWAARRSRRGEPPAEVLARYGAHKPQVRAAVRNAQYDALAQLLMPALTTELSDAWVHVSAGVIGYLSNALASLLVSGALTQPPTAAQAEALLGIVAAMAIHEGRTFGTPDHVRAALLMSGPQLLPFSPALGMGAAAATTTVLDAVRVPTA